MGLIQDAIARTDQADLLILANVETIRDQVQPATASAVASLIGGAPVPELVRRLKRLHQLGALDVDHDQRTWQLSEMGAELLRQELIGWSPSQREENRREYEIQRKASVRIN